MTIDSQFAHPARSLGTIRLVRKNGTVCVLPTDAEPADMFSFPTIPMSMTHWLMALGERFWIRHRRCLGVLLLLNCPIQQWKLRVPVQRCSADSACWSANVEEGLRLDAKYHLAGTFQTRVCETIQEVFDSVPPAEGVHLVQQIHGDDRLVHAFMRVGDETFGVRPGDVIEDDWEAQLEECDPRLTLM